MKKRRETDCKQIEKLIPFYLDNRLNASKTKLLLEHVKSCKACKEELTIQYMVSEGLNRAEQENDYNLVQGLENRNSEAMQQVNAHEFLTIGFLFILFFLFAIIVIAIFLLLFK